MIDRKFYKWLFLNGIKLYVKFRDRNKQSENTTNVLKNNDMNEIKELIDLLLYEFDEKDRIEVVERLNFANNNPKKYLEEEDSLWELEHYEPTDYSRVALKFAIYHITNQYIFFAEDDSIDTIYEQLEEVLPEYFPEYPNQDHWDSEEFFEWLDVTLISEKTNLELLYFPVFGEFYMQMILVNRKSTEKIIELCQELKINCTKAAEMFK